VSGFLLIILDLSNTVHRMFRDSGRPIGVDLFAGVGGMSLGFERAGFDVVAAVEIDPVHCAAHKYNFPNTAILPRSIVGLKASDIRIASGIGNRAVDCVFGGPPCQGFSLIGKRSLEDPRNNLVLEFVRLVSELDARTFVFENVKGLTVGKQRIFLNELIRAFEDVGYEIQSPWKVFDAANYGTPQHRERLILMGAKKGGIVPKNPPPTYSSADMKRSIEGLPKGPTCKDAIGDLPDSERFVSLTVDDCVWTSSYGKSSEYAKELRCQSNDPWVYGYVRNWNPAILTSSARTTHTEISRRRFSETQPGNVEPISRFFRLSAEGLSNTLRAGTDGSRGAFTSPRPIHYKHSRCITVREMARLHGFPDWFRFHATKWHGARQIGNAVPPPLALAVAKTVISALNVSPTRPFKPIELGDSDLLYFDMSEAARYFNVVAPSGKRDKKSGAKKRKQSDIEEARLQQRVAHG
jgi:DNA (cytosine-5)-methyltransferase 1